MDIDLPLILMIAVLVTGIIWLLDWVIFSKPRQQALEAVEQRFAALSDQQKDADAGYQAAYMAAVKEPMLVEYSKSLFPILAIVFVLRSFLIEPFKIPSESMVPTLEVGDFIAVNKFSYGIRLPVFRIKILDFGQPKRGDVVVFFPPHQDNYFIKRVVGLPGDEIRYQNNILIINGKPVPQTLVDLDLRDRRDNRCPTAYQILEEDIDGKNYLVRKCPAGGRRWNDQVWVVPEGHYFMVGDNRDNSADARDPSWTSEPFVPDRNIVGKAFAVWMHWGQGWPSFSRSGGIR